MTRRWLMVCVAVVVLLGGAAAWAEEPHRAGTDARLAQALRLFGEWLEAKLAYEKIPGASVGLVVDQDLAWSRGFGYADVARKVPATPDTIYGICSISKLFTAIAVMQQRDAGKLRLDDPVSTYLPYFTLKATSADDPPVRIRDLLTHSGGVPRESAQSYWDAPDFNFPTKEELITGLASQRMLYPPERYYQYSNLGMTLAGEVVEQVSGAPYERYVQESILQPLKLTRTTTALPEGERGRGLATGYGPLTREGTREPMPFYDAKGLTPAAGLASNVRDLGTFASWQFRLLRNGGEEVLKAATLREMQRVQWVDPDWRMTRGLGFRVRREGNETLVGHYGSCPGYRTEVTLNPRRRLAAVVMINAMSVNTEEVATQLLKVAGAALGDGARPAGATSHPAPDLERFAGLYRSVWGELTVVPWDGGLAVLDLPTPEILGDLVRLKQVDPGTFRRIRDDGDDLGEEVRFETGPEGSVTGLVWHQAHSVKVR
jgi:CubicO group peptidase (beta-lactamase class C family)